MEKIIILRLIDESHYDEIILIFLTDHRNYLA
jgi:hypothetical protein